MNAIAPGAFCAVHSLISLVRELVRIDRQRFCGIERRNADGNAYGLGIGAASPLEVSGETFSRTTSRIPGCIGHHNRGLVASPPGPQISFTKCCSDRRSNAPYDAITLGVSPFVVDPLQSIDIDEEQRHWGTVPLCAMEFIAEPSSQDSSVRQSRQSIRFSQRFEAICLTTDQIPQRTEQDR